MNVSSKALAINGALILITTAIGETVLHELAHYLTGAYLGLGPKLHHNFVDLTVEGTAQQQMITAAAGPLFSLLLGIVSLLISINLIKPSLLKLFVLWLGLRGILSFLGYILIAPIAAEGDTGFIFSYFGVPLYLAIALAIVSIVVINKLFRRMTPQFAYYKYQEPFHEAENARQLFLYPILSSIVLVTLLSLPVPIWISLLPTIFMPMAYFSMMGHYRKLKVTHAPVLIHHVLVGLVILTVAMVIVFRMLV